MQHDVCWQKLLLGLQTWVGQRILDCQLKEEIVADSGRHERVAEYLQKLSIEGTEDVSSLDRAICSILFQESSVDGRQWAAKCLRAESTAGTEDVAKPEKRLWILMQNENVIDNGRRDGVECCFWDRD